MRRRDFVAGLAAATLLAGLPSIALAEDEIYLAAYTRQRVLIAARGERPIEVIRPLARGTGGTAPFRLRGSEMTPLGEFRIGWVNRHSRFHRFFGLNYPLPDQAYEGYRRGVISRAQCIAILKAHAHGEPPPQNTPLGGYIGLHGLGGRNRDINAIANWTDGCLAVTDHDIDRLSEQIGVGTRVFVS
ncbi:MAG TPA: L,D-transpeptidase [Gammaproteobacteria bacterium]|nr:L,D-transpeptidase [Gammaproteobacteria bacterium]